VEAGRGRFVRGEWGGGAGDGGAKREQRKFDGPCEPRGRRVRNRTDYDIIPLFLAVGFYSSLLPLMRARTVRRWLALTVSSSPAAVFQGGGTGVLLLAGHIHLATGSGILA
jgi:hypothetical protein